MALPGIKFVFAPTQPHPDSDHAECRNIELVTCSGRSLCAGVRNWEGSQTARRWEAEDRNRCLDVISARQVKHDCRYPGTVPLQIRWTAVDVVDP